MKGTTHERQVPLGFASADAIAPHASAMVSAAPDVDFQAQQLVLMPKVADAFVVLGAVVGGRIQFSEPIEPIKGSPDVFQQEVRFDTCKAHIPIMLIVHNESNEPAHFRASLIGAPR